jgi:hypothetical protein
VPINYVVYFDVEAARIIKEMDPLPGARLICANKNQDIQAHYQYRLKELKFAKDSDNTGKKALILAHDFLKFDEIYLIGFDFKTEKVGNKEVSHFFGDAVGKHEKYLDQMKVNDHISRLDDMISQFDNISHYDNVYNLSKDSSKLKCYPYKPL